MLIRKQYKFEGAHVVRGCSSERCKKSIHGHSYVVEVFLQSDSLDNGMMVYDFGLMKSTIHELIDSFDHAYTIWDKENEQFKQFIFDNSDRWVQLPVSPSAECYSVILFAFIDNILKNTTMVNGEHGVRLHSVRVHETTTGYAEAFKEDLHMLPPNALDSVVFSDGCKSDWKYFTGIPGQQYVNQFKD